MTHEINPAAIPAELYDEVVDEGLRSIIKSHPEYNQNLGDEAYTIAMDYHTKANEYIAIAKRKEIEAFTYWAKAEMLRQARATVKEPSQ